VDQEPSNRREAAEEPAAGTATQPGPPAVDGAPGMPRAVPAGIGGAFRQAETTDAGLPDEASLSAAPADADPPLPGASPNDIPLKQAGEPDHNPIVATQTGKLHLSEDAPAYGRDLFRPAVFPEDPEASADAGAGPGEERAFAAEATGEDPVPPAQAEAVPTVTSAPNVPMVAERGLEEADPGEAGPNWMLAFVCAWASGTALYYAWKVTGRTDLENPANYRLALTGYAALGFGLLMFALEAVLWGKLARWRAGRVLLWLVPLVLTLVGVLCLFRFVDPSPTWGRI
jgi:hypothetical protein